MLFQLFWEENKQTNKKATVEIWFCFIYAGSFLVCSPFHNIWNAYKKNYNKQNQLRLTASSIITF